MATVPLLLDAPASCVRLADIPSEGEGALTMRTIGNILWFVLAGWWLALYYVLCGLLACVLIVTIPFGIAAFRLAGYAVAFGRTVIVARRGCRVRHRQHPGSPCSAGTCAWPTSPPASRCA